MRGLTSTHAPRANKATFSVVADLDYLGHSLFWHLAPLNFERCDGELLNLTCCPGADMRFPATHDLRALRLLELGFVS